MPRSIVLSPASALPARAALRPLLIAALVSAVGLSGSGESTAAEHLIQPGESPQAALDEAAWGDRLVFTPGVHLHGLGKQRALLYVDRSIEIELQAGAVLKLRDGETQLETEAEITTDHGAPKRLDDLTVGGTYDLSLGPTIFTIVIDGEGQDGQPDSFAWGVGEPFDRRQQRVPITGDWQPLAAGTEIRFAARSGHNRGSLWFISYDGPEAYGIRIGHGLQPDSIEDVRIIGRGTIDLNSQHNVQPSGLVKNINACVLVHGRVRRVVVEGITMTNTNRSVMLYGEHTGQFLAGGGVTPGESFDAEEIDILRTRTINPTGSGYLLGHPSHRGHLRRVRCNFNCMITATTAIEPNFQLDQYEVIGNVIQSDGQAIHCWRHSTRGLIADNLRIQDVAGRPVVVANAPGGWQPPSDLVLRNNRNLLCDPVEPAPPAWSRPAGE